MDNPIKPFKITEQQMPQHMKAIVFLCAAALLAGCTSVSTTPKTSAPQVSGLENSPYRQIMLTNYGYYLFNWIPLFSGGKGEDSFALFSDTVNLETAMKTLDEKCRALDADEVADLQTSEKATCFLSWVPYIGTSLGLYWYKEIQVSAVVSLKNPNAQNAR